VAQLCTDNIQYTFDPAVLKVSSARWRHLKNKRGTWDVRHSSSPSDTNVVTFFIPENPTQSIDQWFDAMISMI
jgi:hypothetical protein